MNKNRIHIFLFIILSAARSLSQDLHFSQFNENHALINPALTGATDPFRASISYRNQWRSITTPFKTYGMSFETRFNTSNWKEVDKFRSMTFKERSISRLAWGLSVYSDKAGTGNLASTIANLSLATFVPINKKSFLAFGMQARYVQQKVDNKELIFSGQYNGYGYDPTMPSHERFASVNYNYFGFSGGGLWSYGQDQKRIANNGQVKGNLGVSFYHLNPPHEGFYAGNQITQMKYVVHGDLLYAPAEFNHAIAPSFLVQKQGSSLEILFGTMLRYYIADNSKYTGHVKRTSIGYGVYYRNSDAAIIALNFEKQEQYVIGLSYDVNISKLSNASQGRGALEITLRYTPPKAFLYQKKAPVAK